MRETEILEEELIHGLAEKNSLEKAISVGFQGNLELKKEEKILYLGQFRERVLRALTFEQLEEKLIYPEIRQALADPKADKLIISGKVSVQIQELYRIEAKKQDVPFLVLNSPEFQGSIGLVVVSDEAVDRDEINVISREEKLLQKGVSLNVIRGVGGKLCPECYRKLIELAPEEKENYQVIRWWERLLGAKCISC